jgi:4-hydroxy-tetrahydrodipicolinate synthase
MEEKIAMNFEPKGIIPPLVTPFSNDGSLNELMLRKVINHVLDADVHGVFIAGSTGESYTLDAKERIRALEVAIEEVNGRVPVYAGTAHITTAETVRLTKAAESAGAAAVSIVTPFFITPNDQELYQHYKTIADSTKLPILLYNNPARTGVHISLETIQALAKIENIVGMKDSSGDMTYMNEVIRNTADENFSLLCGRDTLIFSSLLSGGTGAVPASANIAPKLVVELYDQFQQGNLEAARQAQFTLAPLRMAFSLGSFPVVMKEGMQLIGLDVGSTRPPILPMNPERRDILKNILKDIGLIP